ncbi:MAG: Uma2 family endonuclease [Cyanobacteriota bacterium]|nr:Uma2 family endonuclease [Cyanobacteriota bacterium]
MVKSSSRFRLPTSAELPCSDETPVDNEDQNFIPNFLLFLLEFIWASRNDWFFGVDMGVYHTTGANHLIPVVPDGFLSLGVERRKGGGSRSSYVMWEEEEVAPILALEVVSQTPGGEYDKKEEIYARLGVLYYVIYNPHYSQRDRHQPLEIYRLVNGTYRLQIGEPFWMPEIGLGIGRGIRDFAGVRREVLYWWDDRDRRYLASEEAEQQARQELETARQQLDAMREELDSTRQQLETERQEREQMQRELERYRQQFGDFTPEE